MAELTKERLKALSNRENVGAICSDEIVEMARQLLGGLEQEPVHQVQHGEHWRDLNRAQYDDHVNLGAEGLRILYAAPQLPQPAAVPSSELLSAMEAVLRISDRDHDAWHRARKGIADFRAAMLQGAKPPAYEIKRFGEFGANGLTRDDGELAISIQLFHFERGTTPQPVRGGGIVEKYALQAIINALQQQCDRLSDTPIPVIWPAAPQQEVK